MQVVLVVLLVILSFANCDSDSCAIDLALILDDSGSISKVDWPKVKLFAKEVVHKLGDVSQRGSHVAVLQYSDYAVVNVKFNTFKDDDLNAKKINQAIDNMKQSKGLTFLDRALKKANEEIFTVMSGMREKNKKVAIIMTDGKQTIDRGEYTLLKDASKPLKDKDVKTFVVGVGPDLNLQDLVDMASEPKNVYTVLTFDDLVRSVVDLKKASCPTAPKPTATPIPTTKTECTKKMDMGIIWDVSNSLGIDGFTNAKNAIIKLVQKIDVSPEGSHVGLLRYARGSTPSYYFRNEQNLKVIIKIFTEFSIFDTDGTRTDTSHALEKAGEIFFKPNTPNNRPDVNDIAVLFTDGRSSDGVTGAKAKYIEQTPLIVVGIKNPDKPNDLDEDQLLELANYNKKFLIIENIKKLVNRIDDIIKATCSKD